MIADKISDSELEVMKILWREKTAVSSVYIRKELQQTKGWEKSTILTLIRRLVDKEVITAEKRNIFYYTPNVLENEYTQFQTQNMINKLYGGSVKNLVAALCHTSKMTKDDVDELKDYFKMEEEKCRK